MKKIIFFLQFLLLFSSCSKDEYNFTNNAVLPVIEFKETIFFGENSLVIKSTVLSDGGASILKRGLCWSTNFNDLPTINDNITIESGQTGSFESEINGLVPGTVYHIRPYVQNIVGTSYGEANYIATMKYAYALCDNTHSTIINPITSITGKIWMDRNLGATRVATSRFDYESHGCLFQWGRGNDGHANITWSDNLFGNPVNGVTNALSTTDLPGNSLFILSPGDWRSPMNNALWQGVNGVNNPCPTGYRVPTMQEITAEANAYGIGNYFEAYNSIHKFPVVPYRRNNDGGFYSNNTGIKYWTSTPAGSQAYIMCFYESGGTTSSGMPKATGLPVRCIKN